MELLGKRKADAFEVDRPNFRKDQTLSIALPGSIVANAQSAELRTYLAGQIARTAAIFCINEIVVFKEENAQDDYEETNREPYGYQKDAKDPTKFLVTILKYLETPQYLRKLLFPMSPELRFVGLLNPLNLPSHCSIDDPSQYREGVVVNRNGYLDSGGRRDRASKGEQTTTRISPFVQAGLRKLVQLQRPLDVGTRITVDLSGNGTDYNARPGKYILGNAVDPTKRDVEVPHYWGYSVRQARSLSEAVLACPYGDKYDLVLGTSERGTSIADPNFTLPSVKHTLIVFGGVKGLEHSASCDPILVKKGLGTPEVPVAEFFDFYVNTCPEQGSRTIRCEEAIPISLAALQPFL